jgi:hypothetical protein
MRPKLPNAKPAYPPSENRYANRQQAQDNRRDHLDKVSLATAGPYSSWFVDIRLPQPTPHLTSRRTKTSQAHPEEAYQHVHKSMSRVPGAPNAEESEGAADQHGDCDQHCHSMEYADMRKKNSAVRLGA